MAGMLKDSAEPKVKAIASFFINFPAERGPERPIDYERYRFAVMPSIWQGRSCCDLLSSLQMRHSEQIEND
jgi:hypothetical protein